MATLKVANWNIEWMNRWFTSDKDGPPQLKPSAEIRGVSDIGALATRVANVIRAMDADILTIQEGPSRRSEMALFVQMFLDDAFDIIGPAAKGQQKLYMLVNKQSAAIAGTVRVEEELGVDFDDVWEVDIDADMALDDYRFTRPPLVVKVETSTGKSIRLITIHSKSKYVHNGKYLWDDPLRRPDFVAQALKARRRISAEAMRIRDYIERCLHDDIGAPIIVTGDYNDGPGLDYFERRYLTHNVAGLIAGSPFQPQFMLRHAFIDLMDKELNFTAIFDDFIDDIRNRKILLDHIFVSPSLFWDAAGNRNARGMIEHDLFNAEIDTGADTDTRQHLPSDHRPQTVTLEV